MEILGVESRKDGRISISRERWNHIVNRHPEMKGRLPDIREALEKPDVIEKSKTDDDTRIYYKKKDTNYITVPIQVEKGFIKTAYIPSSRKGGEVVWRR